MADRVRHQSRPSGRRRVSDLASRRIAPQTRPSFRQRASNQASSEQTRPGGREPQTRLGSRQGASHWARRQTGGLRPGPAADRGPQTGPGSKQGASDQARWQTGGLRPGPVAGRGTQTGPGGRGWGREQVRSWCREKERCLPSLYMCVWLCYYLCAVDREPHTGPCGRQGASDQARRQTGGLRPGPAAGRGPQIGLGGRQGASDRARWQPIRRVRTRGLHH